MRYLKCTHCGHLNEVKTEYLTLCSECNKKLENNYTDWKEQNPDKSFEDFNALVCVEEEQLEATTTSEQKPKKNAGIKYGAIFLAALAVFFIIGHFGGNYVRNMLNPNHQTGVNKEMMKIVGEINKSCPMMVDAESRLDNVEVLSHQIIQFNYTLVNCRKESCDFEKIKIALTPEITKYVKTNPQMEAMREANVTFNYEYRDANKNQLFVISITPKIYMAH
ncbi:MAG: hypothetical protein P4L28_00455 [Paludibacteraceae bacterium]|nr:hypothetical protein [Paludibacteraceae bacterium]